MFKIIRFTLLALQKENELELAYLYGKKLLETAYMKRKLPKHEGLIFRIYGFTRYLLSRFERHEGGRVTSEVLIYAGTDNQYNSLAPTIDELSKLKLLYDVLLDKPVSDKNFSIDCKPIRLKLSLRDLVTTVLIFTLRAFPLYRYLRKHKLSTELNYYFDEYCKTYLYLPYFLLTLNQSKIKLVVMSNDHNLSNRSLRLAAEVLGIKTLYMQHASVSEIFPPLEFDYALLDGEIALDTYSKCYEFDDSPVARIKNNIKKCTVVLSGQKKLVEIDSNKIKDKNFCVGFGVNLLDDFYLLSKALEKCIDKNVTCVVRTHPRQSQAFLKELNSFIIGNPSIHWSNPRSQNLADFFSCITCMVAGNTSLHLEAALAGLDTFYWEMSDEVHLPDYYRYVKNGLALHMPKKFDLQMLVDSGEKDTLHRVDNIRRYSETYHTNWQNKEGKLTALIISKILSNESLEGLFVKNDSSIYKSLFKLKDIKDAVAT